MSTLPKKAVECLELRPKGEVRGVFLTTPVGEGQAITLLKGVPQEHPSRHTIQVGEFLHLDDLGIVVASINHSCEPNAMVDLSNAGEPAIVSLRDIGADEELEINYCATEEDMAEPFMCDCESLACYLRVKGFFHLAPEKQAKLLGILSPFLREKYFGEGGA